MKQHISCAEAAQKAMIREDDPMVMYLVVRHDLGMGSGKIAAQVGHAVQMLMDNYRDIKSDLVGNTEYPTLDSYKADETMTDTFYKWLDGSWTKVVLKASDKEFEKIKEEFEVGQIVVVQDAGRTEVAPMTETVIGLCPMLKSKAPKCIKRLQLLK